MDLLQPTAVGGEELHEDGHDEDLEVPFRPRILRDLPIPYQPPYTTVTTPSFSDVPTGVGTGRLHGVRGVRLHTVPTRPGWESEGVVDSSSVECRPSRFFLYGSFRFGRRSWDGSVHTPQNSGIGYQQLH